MFFLQLKHNYPPICQNPLNPSPYISITIKNPQAYQKLLHRLSTFKRHSHARLIMCTGGIPITPRPKPSLIPYYLFRSPPTTFSPLLPTFTKKHQKLGKKLRVKTTDYQQAKSNYGEYDPNIRQINVYPDNHLQPLLIDNAYQNQTTFLKAKALKQLKPDLIDTLLEELAHSFQLFSLPNISHFKHLKHSRQDLVSFLQIIFVFWTIALLAYMRYFLPKHLASRVLIIDYLSLFIFFGLIALIYYPRKFKIEDDIYQHDPYEIHAKQKAKDPTLVKLANQAFDIRLTLTQTQLNHLQATYTHLLTPQNPN